MYPVASLAAVATGLLLAAPAPKPAPTLLGSWQVRSVDFAIPPGLRDTAGQAIDFAGINRMNWAIRRGEAHLTVEFRADSTYRFTVTHSGFGLRTETGTYSLRRGHLQASSPGSADGSSFASQWLVQLARRSMVLAFPVAPALPGVVQQTTYYRVGPLPRPAP